MGIGAGWFERESNAYGVRFPPLKERFERLEETLQIAKQMWSDNDGEYNGKHYKLKETMNYPEPIQKPHPPILIGGMGPNKTLKFVAKYADASNLFAYGGANSIKGPIDTIKKHCKTFKRDFNEIEITTLGGPSLEDGKKPQEIVDYFKSLSNVGVSHAILNMKYPSPKILEMFKNEIIPAVKDF
jgi:alkanesulfonate monooxygenase SsuD/methylene tetrahydromethanopterin reductase-like flavin-dependent oxidoreductase (luciferase family)